MFETERVFGAEALREALCRAMTAALKYRRPISHGDLPALFDDLIEKMQGLDTIPAERFEEALRVELKRLMTAH